MNTWLKSLWDKLNTNTSELWKNDKLFLILFGVIIVALKFRNVFIDLLISSSKSIFNSAVKTNQSLDTQENQNNQAADQLVKDAENLNSSQGIVTDDWNKK